MDPNQDFIEFATAHATRLRRSAYLLCGDWHLAQDLTQSALAKLFVVWRRVSAADINIYGYAQRIIVNAYLGSRRRRSSSELPIAEVPAGTTGPASPELRIVLLDALAALPPRMRAIVVLRYWEDLPVAEVAVLLKCAPGTVKSEASRGLAKLRTALADTPVRIG